MEIRDPEFNRFFSEALKLLSTRRRFCGDFIFRGFVRVFLFSFLSFCFLSLSFFQTDFSFASESEPSSRSLSPGGPCNKVLIKVGALEAEQSSAQQQPSASDLNDPVEYPWLGKRVPDGFWDNEANQEKYMKWLGEKLGLSTPEDWYQVTKEMIKDNSGSGLLTKFNNSPAEMVKALVDPPEGDWIPWRFNVSKGFWNNEANQKAYMKWLGEKLEFSKPEDWYGLTQKMIRANSGGGLLTKKFRGSPLDMVRALVDEAPKDGWLPWEFKKVPESFWDNEENQKDYMKWLGERLGYTKPEDWYAVTQKMIKANKGSRLLKKFRGSPAGMVMALVEAPEGGWRPWLFTSAPDGFWDNEANQKAYMKWLGEMLGLSKPEDWYKLTGEIIMANSGGGLLNLKFRGSPAEMVMTILKDQAPKDGWEKEKFYDLSKMERLMGDILVRWFDGFYEPSFNDRKTHGLKFKDTNRGMEADVLFEKLKFAIEYHGEQHYAAADNWGGQKAFKKTQKRDQEKREAFKNAGYIYIEIPHYEWAGGDEVALKNLILEQLKEYKDSSDHEVKAQAWLIEEVLQKPTNNEDNTSEDNAGTNNESLPMIQPFGESDLSGSESDPAVSSTATSPNTASVGR